MLATTADGTRSALVAARRLTRGVDARVVLLVPRVLPRLAAPGLPDDQSAHVDAYRAMAADVGIQSTALVCVCSRIDDVVRQMIGRSSLVIVGGARRLWWPSHEQRLADRLTAAGYAVVFVPVGAGDDALLRAAAIAS